MCGIAGFVGEGSTEVLSSMIAKLAHRGPDDTGIWYEDMVGFAHARLSIVDLSSGGHQPMHSKDGSVSIIFNGEIYNYQELREELRGRGRVFRSESDTEVIIQAYEVWGEKSFERLRGMYAFCLYDKKSGITFLVRDRMGEKPLYWTHAQGTLVFASEPKALFVHPRVSKELSPEGVLSYLVHDAVLTPGSIFAHIQKLQPAVYLKYVKGQMSTHVYWHPPVNAPSQLSFSEAKEKLDELFSKSVSSQMVADVPVGVFLSGGLDSSLVAYYAQQGRQQPIHTFSLGFTDSSYDESPYARQVAATLGTEHHERIVSAGEVRGALSALVPRLDEPIADPAILPNYLLSCFAREHVKVALGGDGGDELFAGYQTFTAEKLLHWYRLLPDVVRRGMIERIVEHLPVSHRYFSFDFKAKQFLRGARVPERYAHQAWLESFSTEEQKEILTPAYRAHMPEHPYHDIDVILSEVAQGDIHLQNTYFYLRTYMLDDILAKVDRASMYTSLEVRAPFLDVALVEFALSLPWDFKYRGMQGKYILRELMKDRLPKNIVNRKKHGFGIPVGSWFRHEWREFLKDTLSPERVRATGVFSPEAVERLVCEHQDGTHNHRKKLWSLLVFHLWYDAWIS